MDLLEGLNEDKIISMFQPKKGTNQLINKVKETLYINSTNKLVLKDLLKNSPFCPGLCVLVKQV